MNEIQKRKISDFFGNKNRTKFLNDIRDSMNKFLIFGDSFADEHSPPHPSSDENDEWQEKHSYRWPIKLKEKFDSDDILHLCKNLIMAIDKLSHNKAREKFVNELENFDLIKETSERLQVLIEEVYSIKDA